MSDNNDIIPKHNFGKKDDNQKVPVTPRKYALPRIKIIAIKKNIAKASCGPNSGMTANKLNGAAALL